MLSALDVMFLRTGSILNFYEPYPRRSIPGKGFGFPCRSWTVKYNPSGILAFASGTYAQMYALHFETAT